MPKIIVTSRYMKSGSRSHIGNYIRYIATREGVSLREKNVSPTKNQEELIAQLLNDFPDSKELTEYEKYSADKNFKNASECISAIIDRNMELLTDREMYINYLGTRPNAVRFGSHGLFSETDEPINLSETAREIALHKGNVWTHVVSLRREDAERMGYNTLSAWRGLVMRHIDDIAAAQKIDRKNLKWYAAFHNKENNPHVHIVVYSQDPKEGFLTNEGIEKIRSAFANDIYRDELQNLYQKQTVVRDRLRSESDKLMRSLVSELQKGDISESELEKLLLKLHEQLKNSNGKKQYGYLKPAVKKLVDEIVSCLADSPVISKMYSEWCELEREKYLAYTSAVKEFPSIADNKVFKPIKNSVINAVLDMDVTLNSTECDITDDESDELSLHDDTDTQEEHEDVISERYFMKWTDEYKRACDILHNENEEETALGIFKEEAGKGNVLAMFEAGKILAKTDKESSDKYYKAALDGFIFVEPSAKKMRPFVQYRIGKMYNYGIGTERNFEKAFEWFERSAYADNKYALYSLGDMYYYGKGVEQNIEKAFQMYKRSADKGNPYGCYRTAKMLESGAVEEDAGELSEKYFKKAYSGFLSIEKETNNAELQYKLGVMSLKGNGCQQDIYRAAGFLRRSADHGNVTAAYRLGKLYMSEQFNDMISAEKYLGYASHNGNRYAMYYLAKIYLFGNEIERDIEKAKELLELSAASGNEYAKRLLDNIDRREQSAVKNAAVSLLNALGRMIADDYFRNTHSRYITESKLQNAIRRKKLALGIKDDRTIRQI